MSIQDDYFDLSAELTGDHKEKLERIWDKFCENENRLLQLEELCDKFDQLATVLFKYKGHKL